MTIIPPSFSPRLILKTTIIVFSLLLVALAPRVVFGQG